MAAIVYVALLWPMVRLVSIMERRTQAKRAWLPAGSGKRTVMAQTAAPPGRPITGDGPIIPTQGDWRAHVYTRFGPAGIPINHLPRDRLLISQAIDFTLSSMFRLGDLPSLLPSKMLAIGIIRFIRPPAWHEL
jgi:hypothetical protein